MNCFQQSGKWSLVFGKYIYCMIVTHVAASSLFDLHFRGYQQQDAHEFLRYMLDRLHTELLSLLPDETLRDSQYISLDHKGKCI